jgi:TolB protein
MPVPCMRFRAVAVVLALLAPASPALAQRLRIVVGGPNFRPFPIAVPELGAAGADAPAHDATELSSLLQQDIDLVRPLELVPPSSYIAPASESWTQPRFADWVNVGASGLVRGVVEHAAGGKIKLTLRFYDVVSQREVFNKSYEDTPERGVRMVHQFVDTLVETLTGEQGIYSSKIAYGKKLSRGKTAIFVSDIDGRNPKRISGEDDLSLLPAWDPSGRFLLFTSYLRNNPDLYRFDRSTSALEILSQQHGLNTGASVSPDGKLVALTLSIDGNTEIYVMDWDGKNLRRLTDSWGQDVSPSWSPDGKRLAFVSSRSGNPHIYVMNSDGTGVRRITFQGNYNQEPDWSPRPDGQIAFTARDERLKFDIFLVHPETGEVTRLTQDDGNNESPSHSPDGHQLAFMSTRPPGGNRKLMVMDVDGNNQRRITLDGGEYETPAWGPRLGYK